MQRAWKLGLAGVGVAGLGGYGWVATERLRAAKPMYEVLTARDGVELRRYEPRVVAITPMHGTDDDARAAAFRVLAGYLFGANARRERMPMTTPVELGPAEGGRGAAEMRFFMPPRFGLDELPAPSDPSVRLERAPPRTVAAICWHGRASPSQVTQHGARVRNVAASAGWEIRGEPIIAQYDAPFVLPFLRRTELLLPVYVPKL